MRRTSTLAPAFFRHFTFLLLGWGLLLTRTPGQAQTLPANEGLVADSTEVRVLRQLYQATGGPQWAVRDHWLQGTSLAEAAAWAGVGVSEGDVTSLSLVGNQLRGPLPASLGQLTGLRHLDLRANLLTDSLPASLGQLTRLLTLDVSSNQLRGRLPAELGNLRQLQGFGADHNQLTGPLPASLGNWAQMGWLSLNDNQLTGPIPASWGRMHALAGLLLQNNRLSGALPDSLANCAQLGYVWLSNNRFTGAFPASWGQLQHLWYLELSANQLAGPLPEALTQLAALSTLNLTGNQLTGPLPDHWERLVALTSLGLGNNQLDGELPASFGQLPSLAYCTLANNPRLSGALPAPTGAGWRHLLYLDASSSALTGPLPDSLGNCRSLVYLNLSDNHLSGRLPATLGQLTSLEQFHAPRNAFTGSLPASLSQLPRLWLLNLSQNQLTGPLPGAWGQLRSLRQLYLAANHLQGPLPDSLGQLAELGYLDLSQNQLTGSLPTAWQGLRGLQRLSVQDNQLSGELPEALPVVELYLDRNRFSGPVPASYATAPTLRTLSLEGNEFTQLPDFNASPNLSQLRLSISDNWLEFDAYERNQHTADAGQWYWWNYSKTQRQPPAQTTTVVNGAAVQLSGRLGGAYNHYQWQRWVGGQWVEMPGATTPSLSWAAVTTAESGTYRTRVVSDWVTGITLYSRPLVLDVTPYQALAQNRPDDTNQGLSIKPFVAADSAGWHSAAAPADMNYVRVWTPRTALTDSTRVPRAPIDSVAMSTQYLDGLGRPVQTVLKQASPQRRDMVQPQAYDGLGREPLAYLPYPDTKNGDGGYRAQALRQQDAFYRPDLLTGPPAPDDPTLGVARTGRPYAETVFEASPLNRVTAQGAAGEAWQVTAGHVVERVERPNTDADSVLWFQPGYDPKSLDPGYQGFYKAGELWGTDVTDAHGPNEPGAPGYRTIEWKDKLGQVVLKQVEANRTGTTSTGLHSRWLRTAYVYDDFQHLRFVLQPEGTKRVLAAAPAAAPSSVGLVSWLPCTQVSGTQATDASLQGHAGQLIGSGEWVAAPTGPHAQALRLRGPAHLHVPLALQPTAFTVAFWVNPSQLSDYACMLGARYDDSSPNPWGNFAFHTSTQGRVAVGINSWDPAGRIVTEPGVVQAGRWQHFVFTYDQGTGTLYRDGQQLAQLAGMPPAPAWPGFVVGSSASTGPFDGDLSEFRVYARALAASEVQQLYQPGALVQAVQPFLFHYRFDGRGRQIAKQVPGQDGETLVVYDQLDRPVLSQDAAQRQRKEWSWTKYDALGRIVLSGLTSRQDTLGQVSLQAIAAADTATAQQYEQRTSQGPHYYTTSQSFPKLGQQGFSAGQVLSVTRYDDYDFDGDGQADVAYDASQDGQFTSGQAPVADALRTTGMVTQTQTRVLGVADNDPTQAAWLTTTTFYDERARPIQVQTSNARKYGDYQQGRDILTTRLDFTGKVVQSVASHQGPNLATPLQVAEFFTYDHTGRLLTTRQQLPGEARPALLDSISYNEIGQAVRKTLGTGRLRQDVDYAYNIRGWLTRLNDPYFPLKADLFNLSLHYEQGFTAGYEQYNGNLTGQTWRGRDWVQRAYGYVYDPFNRLLQGDFVARQTTTAATPGAGAWTAEEDNYRLSFVSYDDNGNILTLRRRGLLQNATHARAKQYGAVDNLSYTYQGNRLLAVDDQVTGNQLPRPTTYHGAPTSLAGDFQEQGVKLGEEYLYDANGNLTQDKNKGITGIVYNHLNLPRQIHFGQVGDSVVFRYAASGQKVAKLVYQTGKSVQRTDYLGPYQYEQDSLKFFPHAEGRVLRFVSGTSGAVSYQREFTVKDHLGNLRLAYRLGQVRTLTATLEQDDNTRKRESQQFDSLSVSPPVAMATGLARSGGWAAKLNAGGASPQPLGPLTQLGVQQGDTVTVTAYGTYPQAQQHGLLFSLAAFVTNLVHPASPVPPGPEVGQRQALPLLQMGLAAGLASLPQLSGGVPQGYLRLLVFDKDSALLKDQCQVVQLTRAANGGYEQLRLQVVLPQNGYVTAYVGSQSDVDVFFDDVSIEHRPGLQVQENQYEPWGLNLAGVDYNSPNLLQVNQYQFNGKAQERELGLYWQDFNWRHYDPAFARFFGVDRLAEKFSFMTDYQFASNEPVGKIELDGLEGISAAVVQAALQPNVTNTLRKAPAPVDVATVGLKLEIASGSLDVNGGGIGGSVSGTGFSLDMKVDIGYNFHVKATGLAGSASGMMGGHNFVTADFTGVQMAGSFDSEGRVTNLSGEAMTKNLSFGMPSSFKDIYDMGKNLKEGYSNKNLVSPGSSNVTPISLKPTYSFNGANFLKTLNVYVEAFSNFMSNFVDTQLNPQEYQPAYQSYKNDHQNAK